MAKSTWRGFFAGTVSNLVSDGAVELQRHTSRLVTEGLCNGLRIHSSRRHGKAKAMANCVRVLRGNAESSDLGSRSKPLMEVPATQRLFRIPLRREQVIRWFAVALLEARLQRAL